MKVFKVISKIVCGIIILIPVAVIALYLVSSVANDFSAKAVSKRLVRS